jgi:anti-sigma-K factor RskA
VRPATARPAQPRSPRRRFATAFEGFFDFATGWKLTALVAAAALLFFVISTVQLTGALNSALQRVTVLDETLADRTAALNEATAQLASVADLQNEVAQLQAERSQLEQATQQLVQQLQAEEQQISSLLTVSQVVALDGTAAAPQAQGTLFVGEDSLVLVLRGLQPLPSGQTYQLWLIPADSAPISAGLVQVADEEGPSLTTDVALTTATFSAVGLSVEPAGGSAQPTGDIVLLGNRT